MSNLITELWATSTFMFLAFSSFIAFSSNRVTVSAENINKRGAAERIQSEDPVVVFRHAQNVRNRNDNATSSSAVEYLTPSSTENEEPLISATRSRNHHETRSHKHAHKKHNKTREDRRRTHNRGSSSRHGGDNNNNSTLHSTTNKTTAVLSDPITESNSDSSQAFVDKTKTKTKHCTKCGLNAFEDGEAVKNLRVEAFIKTLVDKLRTTPEELTSKHERSKHLLKLPEEILEEPQGQHPFVHGSGDGYAKTLKKIFNGRDVGHCIRRRSSGCYRFDTGSDVTGSTVSGQLWVFKSHDRYDSDSQTIVVYTLEKFHNGTVRVDSLITRHSTNITEGWVTIPIDNVNTHQGHGGNREVLLAIRCSTCATRSHRRLFGTRHKYAPLLVVEDTDQVRESRQKRDEDENCDPAHECCKSTIRVDLRDYYLYFLPSILEMPYCHGACGVINAATNHSIYKQRMILDTPADSYLKVCCAPIGFRNHQLLTVGEPSTLINVPDLMVTACGCV